jgi:hypothetical protein
MTGAGTIRKYGVGAVQPSGYFCLASSSDTNGSMITSSPYFQFVAVGIFCVAVNWIESRTRKTSSKLRPVVIGQLDISLIFLSGPITKTVQTVASIAAVRSCASITRL